MKWYKVVISALFVCSIVMQLIFIIGHNNVFFIIGNVFLLLASINLLIHELIKRRKVC